jgi:tellurite resistance protein TehA-like permease
VKPDAFSAVMATGIVSIAAADHGYHVISDVLAGLAAVGLPVLVVVAAVAWRRAPLNLRDPDVVVRLFTFVAACAVLDTRLASISGVLWALGLLAMVVWLLLSALTLRTLAAHGWIELQQLARGAWELASVGTSGLAIVMAALARYTGWHAVLAVATAIWVLAIAVYGLMTSLILARAFAARLDPNGFEPDAWILMGGLAIATLAGDRIHEQATGWPADSIRWVTDVTWIAATLWIAPLIYFGLRHIRRPEALRFAGVWWAMVFPLGMYSATTYAMAVDTDWPVLPTISLVFFWIAFSTWVVVAIGGITRVIALRSRT